MLGIILILIMLGIGGGVIVLAIIGIVNHLSQSNTINNDTLARYEENNEYYEIFKLENSLSYLEYDLDFRYKCLTNKKGDE